MSDEELIENEDPEEVEQPEESSNEGDPEEAEQPEESSNEGDPEEPSNEEDPEETEEPENETISLQQDLSDPIDYSNYFENLETIGLSIVIVLIAGFVSLSFALGVKK